MYHVGDAIQPSHPLLSPSPPTLNRSQHQGLFQLVSSSHQVAKVLEFHIQHQSFQQICRTEDIRLSVLNLGKSQANPQWLITTDFLLLAPMRDLHCFVCFSLLFSGNWPFPTPFQGYTRNNLEELADISWAT